MRGAFGCGTMVDMAKTRGEDVKAGDVVWADGKAWLLKEKNDCTCCSPWIAHDEFVYDFDELTRVKDFRWLVKDGVLQ